MDISVKRKNYPKIKIMAWTSNSTVPEIHSFQNGPTPTESKSTAILLIFSNFFWGLVVKIDEKKYIKMKPWSDTHHRDTSRWSTIEFMNQNEIYNYIFVFFAWNRPGKEFLKKQFSRQRDTTWKTREKTSFSKQKATNLVCQKSPMQIELKLWHVESLNKIKQGRCDIFPPLVGNWQKQIENRFIFSF